MEVFFHILPALQLCLPQVAVVWCSYRIDMQFIARYIQSLDIRLDSSFTDATSVKMLYCTVEGSRLVGLTRRLKLRKSPTIQSPFLRSCIHIFITMSSGHVRHQDETPYIDKFFSRVNWHHLTALDINTSCHARNLAILSNIFKHVPIPNLKALRITENYTLFPYRDAFFPDTPALTSVEWYQGPACYLPLLPSLQVCMLSL